jgi:hypothetical protein
VIQSFLNARKEGIPLFPLECGTSLVNLQIHKGDVLNAKVGLSLDMDPKFSSHDST